MKFTFEEREILDSALAEYIAETTRIADHNLDHFPPMERQEQRTRLLETIVQTRNLQQRFLELRR